MRFLRIFYQVQANGNKEDALAFKTSSGWRVKLTYKDKKAKPAYDYYYFEKDRTKPHWEFRREQEVLSEESKAQQIEDNTTEATEATKATETTETTETTEAAEAAEAAEVIKATEATEVTKATEATEVTKATEATETTEAIKE